MSLLLQFSLLLTNGITEMQFKNPKGDKELYVFCIIR